MGAFGMIAQFVYVLGETLCPLFAYTINNSTYVNSIYDNDTFDRCIIMPYTVTRHAKERRHRERQRYAAGKLLLA